MRWLGLLLFLPVPIVLWLFTASPLGVGPSLILGSALMLTHRLYARPFALRARRCLWCGAACCDTVLLIEEPGGPQGWGCCSLAHAERLRRMLGWAWRRRLFLRVAILGSVVGLLIAKPLADPATVSWAFRGVVACAVLPLGWLGPSARLPDGPTASPFPVHIQALIGSRAVVWLFRIVGTIWLIGALRFLLS